MDQDRPLASLQAGHWFKLICGASYQYLPAIRNLTLTYTLAGADCIDVAADPAVIRVARQGIQVAASRGLMGGQLQPAQGLPWLMVSLNDGEDPHFRKANFQPQNCLSDCSQPCRTICPAQAIVLSPAPDFSGVVTERCYGCGRCLPVCPIQQIETRSQRYALEEMGPVLVEQQVDALEIHTQVGRVQEFQALWQAIAPYADRLRLVAVSCPDGEGLIEYLWELYQILSPLPCPLIWQTDGRPMSGDIGDGTTRAALKLGQKVLGAGLPGYVQLAGGTNRHTVAKLKALGLLKPTGEALLPAEGRRYIAGVAYGSFARTLLAPVLEHLDQINQINQNHQQPDVTPQNLEDQPALLAAAVSLASSLVSPLKQTREVCHPPLNFGSFLRQGLQVDTDSTKPIGPVNIADS